MLFGTVFLIQLELPQEGTRGGSEKAFFEGNAIAVAGQVDTKDVLAIEDKVAFFFHPQCVVHPVPFLLLPGLTLWSRSIRGILGKCLGDENGGAKGEENMPESEGYHC